MLTGIPCSGKTCRANTLKEFFEKEHKKSVVIISENEIIKNRLEYDDVFLGKILTLFECYIIIYLFIVFV
jgi:tRNA uridine 5-carbamoylmethylation protein Kti12